jgi:O-antigen ligase
MAVTHEDRLTTPAKIAGGLGLGFGFFAGAGVTGLSLMIGVAGLWALVYGLRGPERPLWMALKAGLKYNFLVWVLFVAFVGYVMTTATWSPADKLAGESVRRITAMAILAPLAVWASSRAGSTHQGIAHKALLAGLGIALFILVFETMTHAAINRIASPEKDPLAIAGDLGRAATAALALFWAGIASLRRHYDNRYLLAAFVSVAGLLAFQFGTDLNAIGIILGSFAALFALFFPRLAIGILSGACATIMISAPLLYPLINKIAVSLAPGGHLPLSYARRAQMWDVASDLISQKPITGWGLGAGSTFDRIISFGGFDWPLIQLHPHAAPLHIWLETGAVGAALASFLIIAAGGAAIKAFGRHKAAASALVGGLTFLALNWAFSHAAWREWMWTSLAVLIAFALTLRRQGGPDDSKAMEA